MKCSFCGKDTEHPDWVEIDYDSGMATDAYCTRRCFKLDVSQKLKDLRGVAVIDFRESY